MIEHMVSNKQCTGCKAWKLQSEFYRKGPDRLTAQCKTCTLARIAANAAAKEKEVVEGRQPWVVPADDRSKAQKAADAVWLATKVPAFTAGNLCAVLGAVA